MFSAFVFRRRWATVLIFLIGGPVIGMLYLGKGRIALAYFAGTTLAYLLPFAINYFGLLDADLELTRGLMFWFIPLVGLAHGFVAVKPIIGKKPRVWFARWYAIAGLVLLLPVNLALIVRMFVGEPFSMAAASMEPTLAVGDHIWTSKYAYGYSRFSLPFAPRLFSGRIFGREPKRGDIAVFRLPTNDKIDYVKRIIGLPGDRIQIRHGRLFINGAQVARQRFGSKNETTRDGSIRQIPRFVETLPSGRHYFILEETDNGAADNTHLYTVPDGHYFTLGDNRDASLDSRFSRVGFIPYENLVSRFVAVYWNSKTRKIMFERRP